MSIDVVRAFLLLPGNFLFLRVLIVELLEAIRLVVGVVVDVVRALVDCYLFGGCKLSGRAGRLAERSTGPRLVVVVICIVNV